MCRLLIRGKANPEAERKFVQLALTKHPKSDCIWGHARWLLARRLKELQWYHHYHCTAGTSDANVIVAAVARELLREFDSCQAAQRLYPKNYHCWSQRQYLVGLVGAKANTLPVEQQEAILQQEYRRACKWGSENPSDYGAVHHGRYVLVALSGVLMPELKDVWSLLCLSPVDEDAGDGGERTGAGAGAGSSGDGVASANRAKVAALWKAHLALAEDRLDRYPHLQTSQLEVKVSAQTAAMCSSP
jgi:hypothetical protein